MRIMWPDMWNISLIENCRGRASADDLKGYAPGAPLQGCHNWPQFQPDHGPGPQVIAVIAPSGPLSDLPPLRQTGQAGLEPHEPPNLRGEVS